MFPEIENLIVDYIREYLYSLQIAYWSIYEARKITSATYSRGSAKQDIVYMCVSFCIEWNINNG